MNGFLKKSLIATISCFTFFSQANTQTTYANREWVEDIPIVGTGYYHTSTIVVAGKLYVTGNILNGGGNTDIYTMKLDTNGDTLWSATYAGSAGGDDYGIELKASSDGYIYVIGAAKNTSTGYDYCLLKYNSSTGSQSFVRNWNGAGNGDDIPSSLYVDGSSAIYITGGSEASNGFSDYGTIKVSSLNVLGWVKYYNYNNLHDGATSITKNVSNIIVTGGSASAVNDWDIATVGYNIITGNAGTPSRTNITGATMVEANAMATDSLNNIYITGYATVSGNKNIQTIKLDSALALKWIADYEENLEDVANDVAVDGSGNVYVTGYTEESTGKYKGITIKYADDGDTLWTQLLGNTVTEDGIKFRKMAVEPSGEIYLTGSQGRDNLNAFAFAKYDTDGSLKLLKTYQADTLDDDGFDIQVDGKDVYITGFTETVSGTRMTSLKYSLQEKDSAKYYDAGTEEPIFVERDLIVRVDTSQIIKSEVDKLEKEFWALDEIFEPAMVSNIERSLENVCDGSCDIRVYRVFRYLRTTDTTTISRLGETIKIPEFWATFVFEFPVGIDILEAKDSLESLFPLIPYAMPNLIATYTTSATDDFYDSQHSLHQTTEYDSAHVNIEPAWDYTVGKPFVKAGVFDTGVQWIHEDFQSAIAPQYTRVADGYDFQYSTSVFSAPAFGDENGHGTKVAGILGANRNNHTSYGVAGIAGGVGIIDSADFGCALYSLKILGNSPSWFTSDLTYISDAIVTSSLDPGTSIAPYDFGLHVSNNSWHFHGAPGFVTLGIYTPENITLVRESVHFANRANVTFVAARGNFGIAEELYDTITLAYPAILDEDWVLCVGGTGTDGHYHDGIGTVGQGGGTEDATFNPSRGWEIDVAAPSCSDLVFTTRIDDTDPSPGVDTYYGSFNGTSAATPHVAGAVVLMMSYFNEPFSSFNNLAPEDCERIIELSAHDVNYPGVDSLTGYGRLDIGASLQQIDKDVYALKHFELDSFPDVTTVSLYSTNDTITIEERYQNNVGTWFLPDEYVVTAYQINTTVTHNVASLGTIIEYWPRHSSSTLLPIFDANNILLPRERVVINSVNSSTASLTGYVYKVSDLTGTQLGWWPFDTSHVEINMAYTLLIDMTSVLQTTETSFDTKLQLYPNPTNGNQVISFESNDAGEELSISLVDISGNLIQQVYSGSTTKGLNRFEVETANLSSGVYFYIVSIGEKQLQLRSVKTN